MLGGCGLGSGGLICVGSFLVEGSGFGGVSFSGGGSGDVGPNQEVMSSCRLSRFDEYCKLVDTVSD